MCETLITVAQNTPVEKNVLPYLTSHSFHQIEFTSIINKEHKVVFYWLEQEAETNMQELCPIEKDDH